MSVQTGAGAWAGLAWLVCVIFPFMPGLRCGLPGSRARVLS